MNYLFILKLYSTFDENSQPIVAICHRITTPVTYVSTGNEMLVKFYSDGSFTGKGFAAHYRTVARYCGGLLTAPQGTIMTR